MSLHNAIVSQPTSSTGGFLPPAAAAAAAEADGPQAALRLQRVEALLQLQVAHGRPHIEDGHAILRPQRHLQRQAAVRQRGIRLGKQQNTKRAGTKRAKRVMSGAAQSGLAAEKRNASMTQLGRKMQVEKFLQIG